jgi:hypothetical protein
MPVPSHPGDRTSSPSVSVVIPIPTGGRLASLVGALPPVHEVIVVVGPGEDTFPDLPRTARVIRQTRHGAGNAVACGVAVATGDVVVTLPGDASCDPADLPRLVAALKAGADVAEGVRHRPTPGTASGLLSENPHSGDPLPGDALFRDSLSSDATSRGPLSSDPLPGDGRFVRLAGRAGRFADRRARYGDLILLWFMAVLFGCRVSDPGSGFRAFRRDRADRLGLPRVGGTETARGDGRDGELLLTVRSRASGLHVTEVLVTALPRLGGSPLLTGLNALAREHLARRRDIRAGATESIVVLTGGASAAGLPLGAGAAMRPESGRARIEPPHINLPRISPPSADLSWINPPRIAPRTPLPGRHPGRDQGSRGRPAGHDQESRGRSAGHDQESRGRFADHDQGPRGWPAGHDQALLRWPAPNHSVSVSHPGAGNLDHPNSAGLGFPDRRRGERRSPDRRADATPDRRSTNSGRPPLPGGGVFPAGRLGNDRSMGAVAHRRRWRDNGDARDGRPGGQDRPNLRVINGEGRSTGGGRGHLRPVPRPDHP